MFQRWTIGMNVRMTRLAHKLSQEELAERSSTTPRTIQRIEAGEPTKDSTLQEIAKVLEVPLRSLKTSPFNALARLFQLPIETVERMNQDELDSYLTEWKKSHRPIRIETIVQPVQMDIFKTCQGLQINYRRSNERVVDAIAQFEDQVTDICDLIGVATNEDITKFLRDTFSFIEKIRNEGYIMGVSVNRKRFGPDLVVNIADVFIDVLGAIPERLIVPWKNSGNW